MAGFPAALVDLRSLRTTSVRRAFFTVLTKQAENRALKFRCACDLVTGHYCPGVFSVRGPRYSSCT